MSYASSLAQLESLRDDLPQALIVTGRQGIDLPEVVTKVISPEFVMISSEDSKTKSSISVEQIRDVYDQSKTTRRDAHFFIIKDADVMSRGAQAAFLKLLEEPNSSIHFILTTHHVERLADTIKSRAQIHNIDQMTNQESRDYLALLQVTDKTMITQLLFIAAGLPGELNKLVSDSQYFADTKQLVTDARDFLQSDAYAKFLLLDGYKNDRIRYLAFIEMVIKLARSSLSKSPEQQTIAQLDRLLELERNIRMQGNTRLNSASYVI